LPVRIYALAKQLKLDNKALVDLCKTLGIKGKGSALASLSDEEVALIKEHLEAGKKQGSRTAAARRPGARAPSAGVLRREDYIPPAGTSEKKPSVLGKPAKPSGAREPAPPAEKPARPAEKGPPPVEKPAAPPPATPSPQPPQPTAKAPSAKAAGPDKPPERAKEAPVPAGKAGEKAAEKPEAPPEEKPPAKPSEKRPAKAADKSKPSPAIKLAPIPTAKQPPAKRKPQEPAPQKPDMKLPADAIRAGKAGAQPLAEHLRKQEEKRKAAQKTAAKEGVERGKGEPGVPGRERGKRGKREVTIDEDLGRLGGREQRQLRRRRAASERRKQTEDEDLVPPTPTPQIRRLRRTGRASTAAPRKHAVVVELPCTVRSFAEALGLPAPRILAKLLELGVMLNINSDLDTETAELLAASLDVEVELRQEVDPEERLLAEAQREDPPEALKPRPPVVTFLGHVDHGKTSLLDRVLGIDVVSSEKGGITQHIRAYQIEKDGHPIAFVDTPGHEAFTAMRARGAHCTDIAVLVVAADDGVMPQTEEAISHAKAAGVPIVVALNKIDLPGVNPDRVLQELAANELLPSQWGGDVEVVRTSALTGEGIDELLDTVLTVAELHELKANPDRPATGVCLEAEVQPGRGVVAKVLVQKGTLRVGDVLVCGIGHGRVKAMYDTLNPRKKHQQAGPSMPVNLIGLDQPPDAGDRFYVLDDISEARQIAERRAQRARRQELAQAQPHITLENLFDRMEEEQVRTLNIILRADVRGSIEAIRKELEKLEHPEVQIKILQATVGGITEADVHLADASDGVIIGFNVVPDEKARTLAEQAGVQIRRYDIIYEVAEDLRAALQGMLKPEERELELGRALVQRTFRISRVGTVAGCRVLAGHIPRDSRIRVIRDSRVIGDYPLESLKREKDDAKEVREGLECGMKLRGFDDLKEGDILEAYKIEEVARTL